MKRIHTPECGSKILNRCFFPLIRFSSSNGRGKTSFLSVDCTRCFAPILVMTSGCEPISSRNSEPSQRTDSVRALPHPIALVKVTDLSQVGDFVVVALGRGIAIGELSYKKTSKDDPNWLKDSTYAFNFPAVDPLEGSSSNLSVVVKISMDLEENYFRFEKSRAGFEEMVTESGIENYPPFSENTIFEAHYFEDFLIVEMS